MKIAAIENDEWIGDSPHDDGRMAERVGFSPGVFYTAFVISKIPL